MKSAPVMWMRGGTSKGGYFLASDLPTDTAARDAFLLAVMGSPDPRQIDGMGGATSSTSKVVLVARSSRADCDVDYLFGAVAIDRPVVDWSGNCGNLTSAVGPFAIARGLVEAPADGIAVVRIWQANIGRRIVAHVPMRQGRVVELGDFELDGVAFPAAEIRLEFMDPGADGEGDHRREEPGHESARLVFESGAPIRAVGAGLSTWGVPAVARARPAARRSLAP